MRVLVIEEDAAKTALLADLLRGEGHAVVRAGNPDAGLALARSGPWDACLTDGYWWEPAATRAYLAALAASCPVILLSDRVRAQDARAADLGVAAVVPKPLGWTMCLDALAAAASSVGGRRPRSRPPSLRVGPAVRLGR